MKPIHEIVDNFESSNREKFSHNLDFMVEQFKEAMKKNGHSDGSISKDQLAALFQAAAALTIDYHIEFENYLNYLGVSESSDS